MDPLLEHEIIAGYNIDDHEETERVLDRLRRNDPTLKELTLESNFTRPQYHEQTILQVFDAIATNSSLEELDLYMSAFLGRRGAKDRLTRALITNTSVKHLCLRLHFYSNTPGWVTKVLDIVRASPNLEALTLKECNMHVFSGEDITALAHGLCAHTNLHSLTIERFEMDSDCAAFAAAFQANQTIKTLIMMEYYLREDAVVSFAEALPHKHSLETIIFDVNELDDDSAVTIVRTLCGKHLKNLSLVDNVVSRDGCERNVQTLKENDHSFIKLDLFQDEYEDYPWLNKTRLDIDMLTWENHLKVEKDTWVNRFIEQHTSSQELLFLALERAKKVDNQQFSKAPNLLFHVIKEAPELIAQAIRDGL